MTEVGSTYLGTEQGSFDCAEAGSSQCLKMDTNRGGSYVALMAQSETANLSCHLDAQARGLDWTQGQDCPQPDQREAQHETEIVRGWAFMMNMYCSVI